MSARIDTGRGPLGLKGEKTAKVDRKPMRKKAPAKATPSGDGPHVNPKLRAFANGKPCQMRGPRCNHNPETTVLCHSRRGANAGMAQKPHDFWSYHGCSDCHAWEANATDHCLMTAIRRTQDAVYRHFGTLTP